MAIELTLEEREALAEMVDSDGYKILCQRVLPQLLSAHAERIVSLTLDSGPDVHKLEVAKYQGSKEVVGKIRTLKDWMKKTGNW